MKLTIDDVAGFESFCSAPALHVEPHDFSSCDAMLADIARQREMCGTYTIPSWAAAIETVCRELVELRKYQVRITQEELAKRSGIDKNSIARYETGETTPSLDKAVTLARALGVTLDELCPVPAEGQVTQEQEERIAE